MGVTSLKPGDELNCPHCRAWQAVILRHEEGTDYTRAMPYWQCRGRDFYAGQVGGDSRYATWPARGTSCPPVPDCGTYSLKALTVKAHAMALTHPRSGRRMMKAEIHRILQNLIYTGGFRWHGRVFRGSHTPHCLP